MARYRVAITDNIFPDLDLERQMLAAIDAELIEADPTKEMIGQIKDADAVINVYYKLSAAIIERLSRCRLIIRNGIGVDTIDVPAATAKGIMVANIPAYCLEEVATHAVALIMACNRKLVLLNNMIKAGIWDVKLAIPINAPSVSTVGLLGFGRISKEVSRRLIALGFRVLAHDPYVALEEADLYGVTMVDLDTLASEADYLSVHCPLTRTTEGIINYRVFERMKPSAYLVNTARGGVINEPDLALALRKGLIAGAALDVLEDDGLDGQNPLRKMENVIMTPHAAWYSEQSIRRRRTQTIEQIIKVFEGGEPASFVNIGLLSSPSL